MRGEGPEWVEGSGLEGRRGEGGSEVGGWEEKEEEGEEEEVGEEGMSRSSRGRRGLLIGVGTAEEAGGADVGCDLIGGEEGSHSPPGLATQSGGGWGESVGREDEGKADGGS